MIRRREMLLMMVAAAAIPEWSVFASTQKLKFILHRGGIVDRTRAEDSREALEAAIQGGCWMVEVDVRRTRDGHAIIHHDRTFERYYGNPGKVQDMTWGEIKQLRSSLGGKPPMEFEELTERCRKRIRLQLDVKDRPHPPEFYKLLIDSLARNNLLHTAYILNGGQVREAFKGRGPLVAAKAEELKAAKAKGEKLSEYYYLFERAHDISQEDIALAEDHQVNAVAAINEFRYRNHGGTMMAKSDLSRAIKLGVKTFQIDSMYIVQNPSA